MTSFSLLFLLLYFQKSAASLRCDIYHRRSPNNKNEIIRVSVLANYYLPRKRYVDVVGKNVSCPTCEGGLICWRKCCLEEDSFNTTSRKCKSSPRSVQNKFKLNSIVAGSSHPLFENYSVLYGSFCTGEVKNINHFKLTKYGNAYINNNLLQLEEYCVDYFADLNRFGVLECTRTKVNISLSSIDFRVTLGFACSEVFLSVTFFIYAYVDKLRALLPNKILVCYLTNLLITNGIYLTLQIFNIHGGTFCIVACKYLHR